jgi:hypothetical protein
MSIIKLRVFLLFDLIANLHLISRVIDLDRKLMSSLGNKYSKQTINALRLITVRATVNPRFSARIKIEF